MRKLSILAISTLGLAAATGGAVPGPALAAPSDSPALLTSGVYTPADAPLLQKADFFWGGRNYCWYGDGWHGPGWYWCGYASDYGWGWGGPWGWHGWRWGGGFDRDHWRGGHWGGGGGHWGGGHGGGHWGGGHGGGHRR